jgi:hypothetical protein
LHYFVNRRGKKLLSEESGTLQGTAGAGNGAILSANYDSAGDFGRFVVGVYHKVWYSILTPKFK